jgi:hypothetical protein
MQYVVQVSGETLNKQNKAYVVKSSSEEEASLIAKQAFCEDYEIENATVSVKSNRRTYKAICAMILISISIFLSLINWKNGHDTISISPDYLSCLYGVLIYTAFVVRFKGIQRTVSSWIDIAFCVFIVLLLSTFVKTILVTKTISLFGLTDISVSTEVILPIAIILSWLGLKMVSLFCMGAVAIIALFNISALNVAMGGLFGPIYIICSFLGIMFYLSVEPAFVETMSQIKHATASGLNHLSGDFSYAKSKVTDIKTSISNKFNASKSDEDKLK